MRTVSRTVPLTFVPHSLPVTKRTVTTDLPRSSSYPERPEVKGKNISPKLLGMGTQTQES